VLSIIIFCQEVKKLTTNNKSSNCNYKKNSTIPVHFCHKYSLPNITLTPLSTKEVSNVFNPLNAKLNSICHVLALLGAHPILHISRVRIKSLK
jgi:hypothetical protein